MDFEKVPRFKGFQLQIICQIPFWSEAYQVNQDEIERQISLAHGWIVNNPRRAPKSDVMRYLNSWMGIADRKGSFRKRPEPVKVRTPEPEPDMTWEEMIAIRKMNMGQV